MNDHALKLNPNDAETYSKKGKKFRIIFQELY